MVPCNDPFLPSDDINQLLCLQEKTDSTTAFVSEECFNFKESTSDDKTSTSLLPSMLVSYHQSTRTIFENYQMQVNSHQESILSSNSSILDNLVEKKSVDKGVSMVHAMWNILPLGASIFSLPYCVIAGGYFVLPLIFIISAMADATGILLVDCLYAASHKTKQRKKVNSNYVDIARCVWGVVGGHIFNAFLVFYLFSGCVVNVILLGKSIHDLLHSSTKFSFGLLTTLFSVLIYPTLFIKKLTVLAYLSMAAVFSVLVGIFTIILAFFLELENWKNNIDEISLINANGLSLASGIIMLSCEVHSVIPHAEGIMRKSSKINFVLHRSFIGTALVKFLVALLGSLTYGSTTQSIVTLNVATINRSAHVVCSLTTLLYAILNYPLNMFIISEFIDNFIKNTKIKSSVPFFYLWIACTRFILITLTVLVAVFVPYFAVVLGLRGSLIGTCLIFIFPCYFHLKLKWDILSLRQRTWDIFLLTVGILFGAAGLYASVMRLVVIIQT
ncbi:vesicular inhibitory amino acid transporter isoform X2 [Hydra vulgaris]|uniref:Vesicular inhibitory amino acid transporter isoform X2 n=1 Tax=Hydra vulgaris TaxID=6087 RepID=A0ABM4DEM7_HYDVU